MNSLRFTAGLSHNIGVKEAYNKLAQDASLLMSINKKLAHTGQPRPKNMNKNLYDSGAKGCAESNIGGVIPGSEKLSLKILNWVSDTQEHNFVNMGHRRWALIH